MSKLRANTSISYRCEGPPLRLLFLELQIQNTSNVDLCLLRSWATCRLANLEVGNGDLLQSRHSVAGLGILGPGQTQHADVVVPLSREILELVEQRRAGGDVEYNLHVRVMAAPIGRGPQAAFLLAPEQVMIEFGPQQNRLKGTIPQSEWLKMLISFGWEETQLVEVPLRKLRDRAPAAAGHFANALEHHRRGEYRACLACCREVFEALAWTRTPAEAAKADMKRLANLLPRDRRGDILNTVLQDFQEFLHLGRHAQEEGTTGQIGFEDSLLALNVTAGVLRYVSA